MSIFFNNLNGTDPRTPPFNPNAGSNSPAAPASSGTGIDWGAIGALGGALGASLLMRPSSPSSANSTPLDLSSVDPMNFGGYMSPAPAGLPEEDIQAILNNGFFGFTPEQIFGAVPEHAPYIPVNVDEEQAATINGNYNRMSRINDLIGAVNSANANSSVNRLSGMGIDWNGNIGKANRWASMLMDGQLPFDDVLGIVANRNELSNALGIPGGSMKATAKDLGLSRLDAFNQGMSTWEKILSLGQAVNPIEDRLTPQQMFLTPTERISVALEQAARDQASRQSKSFLEATADPVAQNLFSLAALGQMASPSANPFL